MNSWQKEPKAPKNPEERLPAVYLMLDDMLEGSPRSNGKYEDICYLEGRLTGKLQNNMPGLAADIASGMQERGGFGRMVHSIGVTYTAADREDIKESALFILQFHEKGGQNSFAYKQEVSCNGRETLILAKDSQASLEDVTPVFIKSVFPKHMTVKASVCFYLYQGYRVPVLQPDPAVEYGGADYQKMISRSLIERGNLFRLKKAIEKCRRGEDVTIAYIGGSITQGAGAKPIHNRCYACLSCDAFRQRFAPGEGGNVHLVKAGVGGTSSELGLTRYEMDVLRYGTVEPDIVVIEYAVNDNGDESDGVCYESLVLMAMEGPGNPAVVLLFSVFMDDWNLQERMIPVGRHYRLPMVSVRDAVVEQFYQDQPVITKRQYFYDIYHPSNDGHRVTADCLDYLWTEAGGAGEGGIRDNAAADPEKEPVIGNIYKKLRTLTKDTVALHSSIHLIDAGGFNGNDQELQYVEKDNRPEAEPEFPCNWMHMPGNGGGFRMKLWCKALLLVYKDSGSRMFGKAEVTVDGNIVRTVDPLEAGWERCNAVIVLNAPETGWHDVTVRMAAGQEERFFTILGFGYTQY